MTIHIWVALITLALGIAIGVLVLFCADPRYNGMSATIIMSTLAFAFSYYQFFFNKFDAERREKENQEQTEKRILNDIKLSVYNRLIDQANIILEDCSKLLIDLNPKLSQDAKDKFSHISVTISAKFNRIYIDIDNYNILLNTNMCKKDLEMILEKMAPILGNLENMEYPSVDDCAELFEKFHKNINDFASKLYKGLL